MSASSKRLLELAVEFSQREERSGYANQFNDPSITPRTEDEIAAEYDSILRGMLTSE